MIKVGTLARGDELCILPVTDDYYRLGYLTPKNLHPRQSVLIVAVLTGIESRSDRG